MRKLNTDKRAAIIAALVEGNSINATCRMCGVAKLTVLRLLADLGTLCRDFHDLKVRGIRSSRIQMDEIWSFVGCKQMNKEKGKAGEGDCWTWTALCADTKLMVSYLVGLRTAPFAAAFVDDVASRLANRVQLTTDGLKLYLQAVENTFGGMIDYSMLVKMFGSDPNEPHRYSPAKCTGVTTIRISGKPDPDHISTSYAERCNLSMRMGMRRFTRLTNGFSKKWENHEHAIALHFFHYNFCRVHMTLKKTPAMAAGLTDRVWTVADLAEMLAKEEMRLENGGRINKESRS